MTLPKVSQLSKVQHVCHIAGCLDLLAVHCIHPSRDPFLQESVARAKISAVYLKNQETTNSRYDILLAFHMTRMKLCADGTLILDGQLLNNNNFLAQLDRCWQSASGAAFTNISLPFQEAWFVYLGYELATQIEPGLRLPRRSQQASLLPTANATHIPAAVNCDLSANPTMKHNWMKWKLFYIMLS